MCFVIGLISSDTNYTSVQNVDMDPPRSIQLFA